jgi:hypothetical protein
MDSNCLGKKYSQLIYTMSISERERERENFLQNGKSRKSKYDSTVIIFQLTYLIITGSHNYLMGNVDIFHDLQMNCCFALQNWPQVCHKMFPETSFNHQLYL